MKIQSARRVGGALALVSALPLAALSVAPHARAVPCEMVDGAQEVFLTFDQTNQSTSQTIHDRSATLGGIYDEGTQPVRDARNELEEITSQETINQNSSTESSSGSCGGRASPYCAPDTDAPHYSSGAEGIIVKGHATCYNGAYRLYINVVLYLCPNPPSPDEDKWVSEGCTLKGNGHRTENSPPDGVKYTQYAPENGTPGAHGTGYWIGCTVAKVVDADGYVLSDNRDVGNYQYLSA